MKLRQLPWIILLAVAALLVASSEINVAEQANGGLAMALYFQAQAALAPRLLIMWQETFASWLANDGEARSGKGWAYYGRLEEASIGDGFVSRCRLLPLTVFLFHQPSVIHSLRLTSGLGFEGHRITSFKLSHVRTKREGEIG
eukprot:23732-Hanusia_phi.AAC.2